MLAKTPRDMGDVPDLPYPVIYYPRHSSSLMLGVPRGALLSAHEQYQFDVIHAVMLYPTSYVAVSLRKELDIPVVVSSRGDVMPGRRHTTRWLPRLRMRKAMRKADAVLAVSNKMQLIMQNMAGDSVAVDVIHNGVNTPLTTEKETVEKFSDLAGQEFILTLGRLSHHKGLGLLLDVVGKLHNEQFDVPILVIAGDGKERTNLEQQVEMSGLSDKVVFAGGVFKEDKAWLLQNCRFFLQPSFSEGGIPNTVLEAISYGKAVIGTDAGGIADVVTKENGIVVPVGDSLALESAIKNMLKSSSIHKLEQASSELAKSMGWEQVAQRHLDLYEDVIRKQSVS